MNPKGLDIDKETFSCPICLELLNKPTTIPCGHSYCMSCINTHWDGEGQSYSCPQCRQKFSQRPVLVKNTMLAILTDGLKQSGSSAAMDCPSSANGDVFCDLCSDRMVKAVKSCLRCQVSYCKEHLQPHYDVPALKKHKLVEPSENLQENICSQHDEVMKLFCRTDKKCICYLCSLDQHKGHDIVAAATERAEKQKGLQTRKQKLLQTIQLKEKALDGIQQRLKMNRSSADAAVEHSDQSLKELRHLLEKRMNEVKLQVRSQQKTEELRVKELQDNMHLQIIELKRALTALDTLSQTEDHMLFLDKFPSRFVLIISDSGNFSQAPPAFQDFVSAAVSKLKSSLQLTSPSDPSTVTPVPNVNTSKSDAVPTGAQATAPPPQRSKKKRSKAKASSQSSQPPDNKPKTAAPSPGPTLKQSRVVPKHQLLVEHKHVLTWDAHSLFNKLQVCERKVSIKHVEQSQNYDSHPLRFTHLPQAVSKEKITGRFYFEVDCCPLYNGSVTVGVCYSDMKRDGCKSQNKLGMNAKSWALECYCGRSVFWHNGDKVEIPVGPSSLVGVFVDHSEGLLSFYRSFEATYIYSIKTTFTQPLVAAVRLGDVQSQASIHNSYLYLL